MPTSFATSSMSSVTRYDSIGVVLPEADRTPFLKYAKDGAVFIDPASDWRQLPLGLPVVLMFEVTPLPVRARLKELLTVRRTENICTCQNLAELPVFLRRRLVGTVPLSKGRLSDDVCDFVARNLEPGKFLDVETARLARELKGKGRHVKVSALREYLKTEYGEMLPVAVRTAAAS